MIRVLFLLIILVSSVLSVVITKKECNEQSQNHIFVSGECIEYKSYEGDDNNQIIVIVHGTWDEGTNVLGRYAPFAETMNLNTDLTTIAIALPGYSTSSTNIFKSLASKSNLDLASTKKYILFVGNIVKALKSKFKANVVTYIGHSAGARIGATLTGLEPNLIQNIALAGGRYKVKKQNLNKNYIAFDDVIDNVNKKTKFLFIYGTKDKISKPSFTKDYFEKVKLKKLNAKLIKVENAQHIDLDMTDNSIEAIVEMIEGS